MFKVNELTFRYKKGQPLLENIDLELRPGNIYGLLGMNGAGKTTLLRLMTGLIFPQSGTCTIDDRLVSTRRRPILEDLHIIPESFDLPSVTIQNYGKLNGSFYPKYNHDQFLELVKEFSLTGDRNLLKLSHGQRKKVLIAFGLAVNTKFLVLDEPTNGLDIPSKSEFKKVIARSLNDERYIIISTHQIADIYGLINHVFMLINSKIILDTDLYEIEKRLLFGPQQESHEVLYQNDPLGRKCIMKRRGEVSSEVDLELLFNALHESPDPVLQTLTSNF